MHLQFLHVLEMAGGEVHLATLYGGVEANFYLSYVLDTFCQKLNKVNGICANTLAACGLLFFCTLALLGYKSGQQCGHEGSDLIAHGQPLYQLSKGKRGQWCSTIAGLGRALLAMSFSYCWALPSFTTFLPRTSPSGRYFASLISVSECSLSSYLLKLWIAPSLLVYCHLEDIYKLWSCPSWVKAVPLFLLQSHTSPCPISGFVTQQWKFCLGWNLESGVSDWEQIKK